MKETNKYEVAELNEIQQLYLQGVEEKLGVTLVAYQPSTTDEDANKDS